MNFYIATDPETGRKIWGKRQDEAKKVDRDFEKRDLDTSQDGLIQVFQDYEDCIFELRQRPPVAYVTPDAPANLDPNSLSDWIINCLLTEEQLDVVPKGQSKSLRDMIGKGKEGEPDGSGAAEEGSTPSLPQPAIIDLSATQLAPIALEAIERVGELGEDAFDALDAHQSQHGVSGSFSRGVHVLSVLSTGEHQLTRLLFRARKAKKWGGA